MNKIDAAKEFIKAGDSIYQDYLSNIYKIDFEMLDEDEKRRKINQYSILYAQIIEYYLKAIILPDLRNANYSENTDEEMNFLSSSRDGIKKFNHIFKRIIFDPCFDSKIKKMIIDDLANYGKYFEQKREKYLDEVINEPMEVDNNGTQVTLPDPRKYGLRLIFSTENNDSNQKLNDLLDAILDLNTGAISSNSDAYPKSRYAMIDNNNYTACLEFLIDFTNAIRRNLKYKFKNCIKVEGCNIHIFPDLDTEVKITLDNGEMEIFYIDLSGDMWIIDSNGKKIDTIGYIWNYSRTSGEHHIIEEVAYIENGEERSLNRRNGEYLHIKCDNEKINNHGIGSR